MQDVLIEKPYQFVPPIQSGFLQRLFLNLGFHRRANRLQEGVTHYEIRHSERIATSIQQGLGVLVVPNHPRTADPATICELARVTPFPLYMMASWHLFHKGWLTRFMVRSAGGFSVNREGMDRKSVDFAINVLQEAKRPLVIFPEGTTSRTNDQLMALMDGPSFIARTAAKRRQKLGLGGVVAHPVAIKYLYSGNLESACDAVLTDIEQRLMWRPQKSLGLVERIIKVGNALLTLMELQYSTEDHEGLTLRERQTRMVDLLLNPLEDEWLGSQQSGGVQIRVKNLRMKIFPDLSRDQLPRPERERRWEQLRDTYLAQQIDSYPDNYLGNQPSVDRILETIEKFEEDLADRARIHGNLKAVVDVCEAIPVSAKRDRDAAEDPLMGKIRESLTTKLGELERESPVYRAERNHAPTL